MDAITADNYTAKKRELLAIELTLADMAQHAIKPSAEESRYYLALRKQITDYHADNERLLI